MCKSLCGSLYIFGLTTQQDQRLSFKALTSRKSTYLGWKQTICKTATTNRRNKKTNRIPLKLVQVTGAAVDRCYCYWIRPRTVASTGLKLLTQTDPAGNVSLENLHLPPSSISNKAALGFSALRASNASQD